MPTQAVQRVLLVVFTVGIVLLLADPVWAGPGGEIVEAVFKTKIGRIVLLVFVGELFLRPVQAAKASIARVGEPGSLILPGDERRARLMIRI